MRAFLSYNVAGDILISGFEYRMHFYLRIVDLFLLMFELFFSFSRRNFCRRYFFGSSLTKVFIHAINKKLK